MKKMLFFAVLLAAMLTGCTRIDAQVPGSPRVVTSISAEYEYGTIRLNREYTSSEKMRSVLDYLRTVKLMGPADDTPLTPGLSRIVVTLRYSDGTSKVYDQRGDQYLRIGTGTWHLIDDEKAQELPLLLGLMESD